MSTQVHQRGPPVPMGGSGSTPMRNRSVRRCLFGPPDPHSTSEYARRKRMELQAKSTSEWNFDFEAERPTPGPLKWEAVGKNNTSACVPKPYALSRLPYLSTHATTVSSPLPRVIHHEPLLCAGVTSPTLLDESRLVGGITTISTRPSSSSGPPCPPPTPVKCEVDGGGGVCGSPEEDRLQGSSGSSQSSSSPECRPSFPSPPTSLEESVSPPNSPTGGAGPRNPSNPVIKSTSSQPRITQFMEQRKRSNPSKTSSTTTSSSAAKKKKKAAS